MTPDAVQPDPALGRDLKASIKQVAELPADLDAGFDGVSLALSGMVRRRERRFTDDQDGKKDAEGPDFGVRGVIGSTEEDLGRGISVRTKAEHTMVNVSKR